MSKRQTLVECDSCGCQEMVVYQGDEEEHPTIYVECDACGMSVVTARAES